MNLPPPYTKLSIIGLVVAFLAAGAWGQAPPRSAPSPAKKPKQVREPKYGKVNAAKVRSGDPDWKRADREVDSAQALLDARSSSLTKRQVETYILRRGASGRNEIALTFDDGPHPVYTKKLLEILRREQVPATFFVVGFMANKYPDLVRAIKRDGHEIGNHTYSHVTLTRIPNQDVLTEYRATDDVVKRLTGSAPRYCRPPGGDYNLAVLKAAATLGLSTVLWTDDPGDYANPGGHAVLVKELSLLAPGAIVLLHDGSQDTLDTLSKFIRAAREKGLQFVTLDQLRAGKQSAERIAKKGR